MDITTFLGKLLNIVIIDLVLAGDNAIVIGLAARNLPKLQQKKAIIWGTVGAIVVRMLCTVLVVYLLDIKFLLAVGGVLLLWIAHKLLTQEKSHEVKAKQTLSSAIFTIVIADTVMGLDNVIAVAGAAHGHIMLVIIGLLITVPIIVWGSTLFIQIIQRYPIILYLGAGILAYTGANMITEEKVFMDFFNRHSVIQALFVILCILAILITGFLKQKKS